MRMPDSLQTHAVKFTCRFRLAQLIILSALASMLAAARVMAQTPANKSLVLARDFYNFSSPTCGIQDAINSLPKSGGQVVLEPRTYVLRAPIVLRDDICITGQGQHTLLTRGKEIIHRLAQDAKPEDRTLTLQATTGLRVGDEVGVRDDERSGWYMSHGIVTKIQGNTITLDTGLVRDYAVSRNAMVINHHPMIEAYRIWDYRYHVRRFVIEDLTIDGNLEQNPTRISDWSTAAIHLASTGDGLVQRCIVRNYVTDGISDQYGVNNIIRDCLVENCRGNGFHPGTSTRGARFENNIARHNEGDGMFVCAGVTATHITGNQFLNNKRNGIGDLGNGDDSLNIVSNNTCIGNGRHGIQAIGGANNAITGNICLNNSASESGTYAGIAIENSTDTMVSGNVCGSKTINNDKPTQGYGILESGKSDGNVIRGNIVNGNVKSGVSTVGAATIAIENLGQPRQNGAPTTRAAK